MWADTVHTRSARHKIRAFLKEHAQLLVEKVIEGKAGLSVELRADGKRGSFACRLYSKRIRVVKRFEKCKS